MRYTATCDTACWSSTMSWLMTECPVESSLLLFSSSLCTHYVSILAPPGRSEGPSQWTCWCCRQESRHSWRTLPWGPSSAPWGTSRHAPTPPHPTHAFFSHIFSSCHHISFDLGSGSNSNNTGNGDRGRHVRGTCCLSRSLLLSLPPPLTPSSSHSLLLSLPIRLL